MIVGVLARIILAMYVDDVNVDVSVDVATRISSLVAVATAIPPTSTSCSWAE